MENAEDLTLLTLSSPRNRYLLAHVGRQLIAFPFQWVAKIVLIERFQVLSLPFYRPSVLGVVHHQGMVIPVVSAHVLLSQKLNQAMPPADCKETLTLICLSQAAQRLSGVGIVVDRVVDQFTEAESASIAGSLQQPIPFQVADVPDQLWQPL